MKDLLCKINSKITIAKLSAKVCMGNINEKLINYKKGKI